MKLALCNEMYGDMPLEIVAVKAKSYGYSALEIAPFTLGPKPLEIDPVPLRKSVENKGLRIMGLHWLLAKTEGLHVGHPDSSVRRRTVEYLDKLAELCKSLGGDFLVFGSPAQRSTPPGESQADTLKRVTESFASVGETCRRLGIFLCIEPLTPKETDIINSAAEAVAVIKSINNPHVMLHLDVKAMSAEKFPQADVIRKNAEYLKTFHANDPNLLGPGMGDVDFTPIIAALEDIGYDNYLSVEVFDFTPGPDEIARKSTEYLRKFVK